MNPRIATLTALAAVALAVLVPASAQAAVFSYASICGSVLGGRCSNVGLTNGGAVSGTLAIDDAAMTPNGHLDVGDILDFSFAFGTATVSFAGIEAIRFDATLNAAANGFADVTFYAAEQLSDGSVTGDSFYIRPTFWDASRTGSCDAADCSGGMLLGNKDVLALKTGIWTLTTPPSAPVPAPALLGLLGLALIGVGGLRALARR